MPKVDINEQPRKLKKGYVWFGSLQKKVRVIKPESRTPTQFKKSNEIDLILTVMCTIAERGQTLNTKEIADICECSQSLISQTIRDALKKLQGPMGSKLRDFV